MTFYYGADYYPEQWPESRWLEDARLMQEAGFNVVRIGEFAWAKMEPNEGRCPDAGIGSPLQPEHSFLSGARDHWSRMELPYPSLRGTT